jgi:hypothetical protein
MKSKAHTLFSFALSFVSIFNVVLPVHAQNPAAKPATAQLVGVWRGQSNHVPAVTLVLTNEGGDLSGAVLFYLLRRENENEPYTATPGNPEPILHAKFDGKTLIFQVSHRRAHPPRTLADPPVTFRLTLTGDGQAQLSNQAESSTLTLTRSDY